MLSRPDWSYAGYTVDNDTVNRYCSVPCRYEVDKLRVHVDDQLVNPRHLKNVDKAGIYDGQWPDNLVVYPVDIHPISTLNPANIQYPISNEHREGILGKFTKLPEPAFSEYIDFLNIFIS